MDHVWGGNKKAAGMPKRLKLGTQDGTGRLIISLQVRDGRAYGNGLALSTT